MSAKTNDDALGLPTKHDTSKIQCNEMENSEICRKGHSAKELIVSPNSRAL